MSLNVPKILVHSDSLNSLNDKEEEEEEEEEECKNKNEEEEEDYGNYGDKKQIIKNQKKNLSKPPPSKSLLNIIKSRPRSASIDVGLMEEGNSLLKSNLNNNKKKHGPKKFFNIIKKTPSNQTLTTPPKNYKLDFSNASPSSFLQNPEANKDRPRRGSFVPQPQDTLQHKVEVGETLAAIAAKYRSTIGEIKSLNKLWSNDVFSNQILYVPKEALRTNTQRRHSENWVLSSMGEEAGDYRPSTPYKLDPVCETGTRVKPKSPFFSATVYYVTGATKDVKGLLTITTNQVIFHPNTKKSPQENPPKNEIIPEIELIKHRMNLAPNIHSAKILDFCPIKIAAEASKEKNNSENKPIFPEASISLSPTFPISPSLSPFDSFPNTPNFNSLSPSSSPSSSSSLPKYLFLKLKKKNESKGKQPFIEAFIKNIMPGPKCVDHFFLINNKIVPELENYLKYYYFNQFNRQEEETINLLPNTVDIETKRQNFRKTLSVAELCNLELPEMSEESKIFNEGHIRIFREYLPPKLDGRPWKLLFSSSNHGFSLKTLYRNTENKTSDSVALILIEDTNHHVFGSILCGGVAKSESFYGSGETFLFSFYDIFNVYPWTGKNNCIARGTNEMFSIGSSGGHHGLVLDGDLNRGWTFECETFDNELLTENNDFKIISVEVWTFPMLL